MFDWLEQAIGALLILLVLLDVFLTVLYARAGIGIISNLIANLTWRFFRLISKPFGSYRGGILSFCGPVILVLYVGIWTLTLALGAALIIHPALGSSVQTESSGTPTDFITALYAGGTSLSIVGASSFSPQTSVFKMFYLFNSMVGMSIVSLTLTYLMQVYNALQKRNAFGLKTHLMTAETGDAAELLARLGPEGKFDGGYSDLTSWADDMSKVKESHHFYPVLFYFRFQEPFYSVSQSALVAFDTVTLIKSALDDEEYAWLKESSAVAHLRRATMLLEQTLARNFLPAGVPDEEESPDKQSTERWRSRYSAVLQKLKQAGIKTVADEQAGAENYVSLRAEWDRYITTLAPTMAYDMDEIDSAGSGPECAAERQDFRARSHFAG